MKKLLLIALAFATMGVSVAQKSDSKAFLALGVKAGANFSSVNRFLTSVSDGSLGSTAGFTGGLMLEIRPLRNFSVIGEALYSKQGFTATGTANGMKTDVTSNMNYLNLPVMANFYLADFLAIKFGAQFGYMFSSDLKFDSSTFPTDNILRKTDFGIPVGVALHFGEHFMVEGRYTFGISNLNQVETIQNLIDLGYTSNRVFTLSVGYKF